VAHRFPGEIIGRFELPSIHHNGVLLMVMRAGPLGGLTNRVEQWAIIRSGRLVTVARYATRVQP
jgi:hypothetical protein